MRIEGCNLTLAITICLCSVYAAFSQATCIELKHYEFFLSGTKERWSEGSLENLIEAKPNFNDSGWLIPAIVEHSQGTSLPVGPVKWIDNSSFSCNFIRSCADYRS